MPPPGIGFWQNRHGQALIAAVGTVLAQWLTANFGNVFGNALVGADGAAVAAFYREQLFKQTSKKSAGPAKVDAQFMAVALATYFTSRTLAGDVAASYGFNVTDTGIGTKIVNVGRNGAAFGVADGTDLTMMQLLLATNSLTDTLGHLGGFAHVYDQNGDGMIDAAEAALRAQANEVYTAINEQGGCKGIRSWPMASLVGRRGGHAFPCCPPGGCSCHAQNATTVNKARL